jgi:hypothetical protein
MLTDAEPPRLLPDGPSVVTEGEFLHRTGLSADDLRVLVDRNLLHVGRGAPSGRLGIFVDELPSMEQLQALGMTPCAGFEEALRAFTIGDPRDSLTEDGGPSGSIGWS